MQDKGRLKVMLVVLGAAVIFGGVIWWQYKNPARQTPLGVGVYYTGPMKGKGGHPVMGDDFGKVQPLPDNLRTGAAPNKPESP